MASRLRSFSRAAMAALLSLILAFMLLVSPFQRAKAHAVIPIIPIAITAEQALELLLVGVLGYAWTDFVLPAQLDDEYPSLAGAVDDLVASGTTDLSKLDITELSDFMAAGVPAASGSFIEGAPFEFNFADAPLISSAGLSIGLPWAFDINLNGNPVSAYTSNSRNYTKLEYTYDGRQWRFSSPNYSSAGSFKGSEMRVYYSGEASSVNRSASFSLSLAFPTLISTSALITVVMNDTTVLTYSDGVWTGDTSILTQVSPASYDMASAIAAGMSSVIASAIASGDYAKAAQQVVASGGSLVVPANPDGTLAEDYTYNTVVSGVNPAPDLNSQSKQAFLDYVAALLRSGAISIDQAITMVQSWCLANAASTVEEIAMCIEMVGSWLGALIFGFEGWTLGDVLEPLKLLLDSLFPFCLINDFAELVASADTGYFDNELVIPLSDFDIGVDDITFDLSPIFSLGVFLRPVITVAWSILLFVLTRKIFLNGE